MKDTILFKVSVCLWGGVLLLLYVPIVFVYQIADLTGGGISGVLLDGGFGRLLGMLGVIYSAMALSVGLGFRYSRKMGNIVLFVWNLIFLVSVVCLLWTM